MSLVLLSKKTLIKTIVVKLFLSENIDTKQSNKRNN